MAGTLCSNCRALVASHSFSEEALQVGVEISNLYVEHTVPWLEHSTVPWLEHCVPTVELFTQLLRGGSSGGC